MKEFSLGWKPQSMFWDHVLWNKNPWLVMHVHCVILLCYGATDYHVLSRKPVVFFVNDCHLSIFLHPWLVQYLPIGGYYS